MKYHKLLIPLVCIAVLFFGCTAKPMIENNVYFDGKGGLVSFVSIIAHFEHKDEVWRSENNNEILSMMAMFNNWKPEENKAESRDLMLQYEIHFSNVLVIYYSSSSKNVNYYCQIDNVYYHLPAALGEYFENILSNL